MPKLNYSDPMPVDDNSIDEAWSKIKKTIQYILENNIDCHNSNRMKRNVQKMVILKYGNRLYSGLRETVSIHLESKVRMDLLNSLNDNFLKALEECWRDYQTSIVNIANNMEYMNKIYVSDNKLDSVSTLGFLLFRNTIVRHSPIQDYLRETLLSMVMQARNGEVIDGLALLTACKMLIKLGITDTHVYEEDFERPFLDQSREFYYFESQKLLAENSALIYIEKAISRIKEEGNRAKTYMNVSTESRIVQVVEEELIKKPMNTIFEMKNSGFIFMLKNQRTQDISCMYRMWSTLSIGLQTLSDYLGKYLREEGLSLVNENYTNLNPITYVQSILDFKDKFDYLLHNSFGNNKIFEKTIILELEYFLNLNQRFPKYLSLFIDEKVKNGVFSMHDKEIEIVLDKVMVLFQIFHGKEDFQIYYLQHLAKRLLLNKSISHDNEEIIIEKLKAECSHCFITQLEGMLNDISLSNTIMNSFIENLSLLPSLNCNNLDLSVSVLTSRFWSLPVTTPKCNIPQIARLVFEKFKSFYSSKHYGCQLLLQSQLGTADITAIFYDTIRDNSSTSIISSNGSNCTVLSTTLNFETTENYSNNSSSVHKYVFQVSTYQMAILMLFNRYEKITMKTIMNKTDINENDLIRALQPLVMGNPSQRVLLKIPNSMEIEPHHEFSINELFTSKLDYVKIYSTTTEEENRLEFQKAKNKVEENKNNQIDAAIIHIMYARKKLTHNTLIMEVTGKLRCRFMPSPVRILNRIEYLIENEYLSRTPENIDTYIYVA